MTQIVTLAEVQARLEVSGHDDELLELIAAAEGKLDDLAGPVVPRTVVETVPLQRGYGLLSYTPLGDVTSVVGLGGTALTGWTLDDADGIALSTAPAGWRRDGTYGVEVTVTYTAGRDPIDPKFKRAAMRYIAWSWRREHGGSDSYMPSGDDAAPGLGVAGIDKELRFILGRDVRIGGIY